MKTLFEAMELGAGDAPPGRHRVLLGKSLVAVKELHLSYHIMDILQIVWLLELW